MTDEERKARREKIRARVDQLSGEGAPTSFIEEQRFLLAELDRVELERDEAIRNAPGVGDGDIRRLIKERDVAYARGLEDGRKAGAASYACELQAGIDAATDALRAERDAAIARAEKAERDEHSAVERGNRLAREAEELRRERDEWHTAAIEHARDFQQSDQRFFAALERERGLREALVRYRDAIDRIYNEGADARAAVLKHFGTLHSQAALDAAPWDPAAALATQEGT